MDDAARLEWLVTGEGKRRAVSISGNDTKGWGVLACNDGLTFLSRGHKTFRDAIDAAMLKHPTVSVAQKAP
jgi:hypothetical protein